MKKLSIVSAFVLLFAMTSCSSDEEVPEIIEAPSNGVTYTGSIKIIVDANCISCHGNPLQNGAPMPLLTLANVQEAIENRNLIGRVEDGSMPSGGIPSLTADQIQAIKDWETNNFK